MRSPQELLQEHGIAYIATTKSAYTTKCPNCAGDYLDVKIDGNGACWCCRDCNEGGPKKHDHDGGLGSPTAVYDYLDENGTRLFQSLRFEPVNAPKQFRQRTDPNQKKWSIKGVRIVPYRLPELIAAVKKRLLIFIVEGEKDVETLRSHGFVATTNPMGAGKWRSEFNEFLRGADVVIVGDNDQPGREHVQLVAKGLHGVAHSIVVLDLKQFWPEIEESDDISDWFERGGGTRDKLLDIEDQLTEWEPRGDGHDKTPPQDGQVAGTTQAVAPVDPVEPVDLWAKFDPPPLPTDLLPEVIEQFAIDQGTSMGADPGGLAAAALCVCAATIPDRIQVQVKRHDHYWKESARPWVALIGPPSTKKSPIINQAVRPLARLDAELRRKYAAEKARYDSLTPKQRRTTPRPKQVRVLIEDTTIESAQDILQDSPNGVLGLRDELSGWFGSMDKYSGHRGAAMDRAFWLQAFNGGPYAVNRVVRGPCFIENLSVSMLGGIQPEPMRKLAEDAVDDGLLQRLFPIVLRPAALGRDEPMSSAVENYEGLVEKLYELKEPIVGGSGNLSAMPVVLRFDDGAQAIRQRLDQEHLDLMACEAINKKLAAHIGKYDALFARLCVTWHCIEHAWADKLPPVITEKTAGRVAKFLHAFLLPHAVSFYAGVLGLSDEHDRLTAVAGYILAHKLERVTNRDVQRGDRTMRRLDRRDIESIFDQLDALGWINRTPGPRPSDPPHWIVNPECHRRFHDRASKEAERRQREREIIVTALTASSED
jgi:hypothetical protein